MSGSERVNLDTILVKEIGQFGRFQLRMVGLATVVGVFTAWAAGEYVFATARINTRCLIPECDDLEPDFTPYWLENAVPTTGQNSFDNCQRYDSYNTSTSVASRAVASQTCPAELFDNQTVVTCHQHVYENTHSVVYDYDLACDEWRRTIIGSAYTFGTLIALPITGQISDKWGRRVALTFNVFNTAWLGVVRYWANSYVGFVVSEAVEAVFGSAGFSCAYILLLEIVGPKYRIVVGAMMNTSFAVGQIILGLVAWGVPNWRSLTLILYIPQFITILYYWLIHESVRWNLSKGRYEDSKALLQKVARVNRKQLSQKSLDALMNTAEEDRKIKLLQVENKVNEPWLAVEVFRHKSVLLRCVVSPVWWITMTFIFHGMSINSVNMSGNGYINYIAVSAAQIPGYWTAVFVVDRIGRKPVLAAAYWVCAACQLAYVFMPENLYAVSLTVYLIGTYSIAIVASTIYLYTAELYPTKHRHTLFAFSSMMGRIGTIVVPLTPAMGTSLFEEFPFVLFGGLALVSGFLVLLTPETKGTKLPDSMLQADRLGTSSDEDVKTT